MRYDISQRKAIIHWLLIILTSICALILSIHEAITPSYSCVIVQQVCEGKCYLLIR